MHHLLTLLVELHGLRRSATPGGRTSSGSGRACAISSSWVPSSTTRPCSTHADAVGLANGREAVRHEIVGRVTGRGEHAREDLRLAAHVELRGRLVEQHHARAQPHRAQRAGQRDALPLPAGEIDAVGVAAWRARCRGRRDRRRPLRARRRRSSASGAPRGRDVVAQRSLEAHEVLEHRGDARAPRVEVELAQVDAVDLDAAGLRVVEAAQQLGERGLARAVLRRRSPATMPAGIVRSKPSSTGGRSRPGRRR